MYIKIQRNFFPDGKNVYDKKLFNTHKLNIVNNEESDSKTLC